ncbi:MAG TPA: hypothetical protein VKY31_13160 [Terriglobia bacterium]|jgi:hypothetical protein|nr:hypothetical protein [Terriglobia bacterium]
MDSKTFLMTGRNGVAPTSEHTNNLIQPIPVEKHFSAAFYAELWGVSKDTIVRWFQDKPGVLKMGSEHSKGRRTRAELRIPFSVAMKEYTERSK